MVLPIALAGASCPKESDVTDREGRSRELPPARDGDIAIQEELDAARRAGTVAAYDLFIARHPGHPLEAVARRERARLGSPPQQP